MFPVVSYHFQKFSFIPLQKNSDKGIRALAYEDCPGQLVYYKEVQSKN